MDTKKLYEEILYDLNNSKKISNIKEFKSNLHKYTKVELQNVASAIDNNIYLGQHGVDDLAWLNLKKVIKTILE